MSTSIGERAKTLRHDTFSALSIPNYRRYLGGQAISMVGTWMQTVAQGWLILQLTGSGTALGVLVAVQTLPILLLGPYAGVIADRLDKRALMVKLQAAMGLLALILGVLTVTGVVRIWQVFVLAGLLGLNNAFENPARQSFILEMVGPADLRNAVSLNSVLVNVARAVGPAIAGIVIGWGSLGLCFMLNAVSFAAVVYSLVTLDRSALSPSKPTPRARGQLREGLVYVRHTPTLAVPLVMMGIVGCFAYEFQVVLPVVAAETFHGDARTYGFLTAFMGVGAVIGGLIVAARGRTGIPTMAITAALFAGAFTVAAVAPTITLEYFAIALLGGISIGFLSQGNSTLQLAAAPHMRGRVMALWSVAFLGSTPIGGPIAGWISEEFGGRAGLALGAVACVIASGLGWRVLRRLDRSTQETAGA